MLKRLLVLNTYYTDIESLKYSFSKQEKYFFVKFDCFWNCNKLKKRRAMFVFANRLLGGLMYSFSWLFLFEAFPDF